MYFCTILLYKSVKGTLSLLDFKFFCLASLFIIWFYLDNIITPDSADHCTDLSSGYYFNCVK
jgi:hypothetical protein